MMLETRQLQYFAMVARERHFGRAAERLSLAQPYLSQQIRKLERQLGTTLLHRTTRSVTVTPAGAHLLEEAERVLAELDTLGTEVGLIGSGLQGPLRLGFTGSTTYGVMPQVVRRTAALAPRLQLSVSGEMITPQLVTQLLDRTIDIALLRGTTPATGLLCQIIGSEPCIAALPSDSDLVDAEAITAADISGRVLVGYPETSVMSTTTANFLGAHRRTPDYAIRASQTSTLMSLIAAGLGMAVVPGTASALALPGVEFRPIVDAPCTELSLARRVDDDSRATERMTAIITEVVSAAIAEPAVTAAIAEEDAS
ncbi:MULTISPECIES: LysR substrate-binding domain-containing protein [unclassified Brevibacterium]|uniref:LysR family transcriptional regulator n=1 Tax=unclassified Brevibacterium TaxID=2614124 RepID=UPI0010F5E315|nr:MULTISPECIES: LysR substrate-binding domain-containing protein [unclassified Brevibacterium]MCM1013013.1 LysR substrate-binding domain-containing protein [Brevibacterium sp. XM4083]